ncbi:hypothetical protein ASPZODRAFT_373938 [Penicilliopsis zonata CBS 506.65]|uniref:MARVEL domain-containing protein n=1 Tax=Penicilliopsis zonata CBS 506.65 TaxID=1073090 RepID=A0A1L9SW10_9EURO|nr:hypothetical protein ASPZODRAFT_373938 [Penicilliopsis zonata CBS 506.65]OJJ51378.1 hypothetical protein ASPZODRAFT_373938 [Penicilliopsis zonata CBS 506.65]
MGVARPSLGFLGLFFVAGSLVLMFLTFLGGARNKSPLNDIYFLQTNTSNIPGAPTLSRWTFWNLCRVDSSGHSQCGSSHPDYPFDPPSSRNFGTTTNIPAAFIGTNHYFLMTRFMFPFLLLGLFFATCSLLTGLLALCSRIGGYISALLAWIALIFQIITTCLMTAAYVQGRKHFNANGQHSSLGVKAFAFMWTAVVSLFLACLLYCLGGTVGRKDGGYSGRKERRRGFFGPQREPSTRSQSSNKESYA